MQTVDTRRGNNRMQSGGFPHSEIHGSKPIPGSPWLIAGYHVLHRLLLPRHPPNALIALDSIRKKTDPERPGRSRLESKFTLPRPRHPARDVKISVLDLDNAAVDRHPARMAATAPPLGCGRQRVSLSERCEASPEGDAGVRLDDGRHPGRCGRQSNRRRIGWWSLAGSNRRPSACKADALPAELRPRTATARVSLWWVEEDLNLRPYAYQAYALTT